jgi:putative flippase GtrA
VAAAILARIISSLVNFFLNARVVFGDRVNGRTLARYYTLAVVLLALSAGLTFLAEQLLGITSPLLCTLVKVVIDTVLFFFSFRVQHRWVFNPGKNQQERNPRT